MKRLALLIVVFAVAGLAACGGDEPAAPPLPDSPVSEATGSSGDVPEASALPADVGSFADAGRMPSVDAGCFNPFGVLPLRRPWTHHQ